MNAQIARDEFWNYFDEYVKANGNKFFVTHMKSGKNQAAGNINNTSPMATQTLCCEYKYRDNVVLVQVYINHNVKLYEYLRSRKEEFENKIGERLEWVESGKNSPSVRRIQREFYIGNKTLKDMVEIVYPYILKFIDTFGSYI